MKKLFIIGTSVLTILSTACSNDETVDFNKDNAIGFKTVVDKNASRSAEELTTNNFLKFNVCGYKGNALIFNGQEVSRATSTSVWGYSPLQYWAANTEYSFTAVGSNAENGCTAAYTPSQPAQYNQNGFGSFTFNDESARGLEDVVYAYANRLTTPTIDKSTQPVALEFNHALSRIKFTFTNGISEAYVLRIGNLKINNAPSSGTFTLPEASWTQNTGEFVLEYTDGADGIEYGQSGSIGYRYIIPGTKTLNINFDVVVYNTSVSSTNPSSRFSHTNVTLTLPEGSTAYLPGHSYNFTAILTTENINPNEPIYPIQFSASVNPWEPDKDGSIDVKEPENP